MVWECDEVRGNKNCKSGYENESRREIRKRKTKKEMVEYFWELYEDCGCVHRVCGKSSEVEF